jgi:transposase
VPPIQPYIIEPIWEQFAALLPERKTDHPLGCHCRRIPERVVFEKLLEVLVFRCAYWRIADEQCSASTLRRRRDEWIEAGAMDALEVIVKETYDRTIGLELSDIAVDCCITKAPCGGQRSGRSPVDRGKRGIKRSVAVDADGIPLGALAAPANRHDSPLLAETLNTVEEILGALPDSARVHLDRGYDSDLTRKRLAEHDLGGVSRRRGSLIRLGLQTVGWWSGQTPGKTVTRSWCGVLSGEALSSTSGSPSRT